MNRLFFNKIILWNLHSGDKRLFYCWNHLRRKYGKEPEDVTTVDYEAKTLLVLSVANSGISRGSFATLIGTPVGIASASIDLVFLISSEKVRMILKQWKGKQINRAKLLYWSEES